MSEVNDDEDGDEGSEEVSGLKNFFQSLLCFVPFHLFHFSLVVAGGR